MSSTSFRILRYIVPISAATVSIVDGTKLVFIADADPNRQNQQTNRSSLLWTRSLSTSQSQCAKAYEHDPRDFDYYIQKPTADDLPTLLHKFDDDGLEVWPWIWTHPNDNGPHYVFIGKTVTSTIVQRIQEIREESPQNNILIIISDDESTLQQAAKEAGADESVFDRCHCGIVTGANLELLNIKNKILMLDDERVITFDYLTIY